MCRKPGSDRYVSKDTRCGGNCPGMPTGNQAARSCARPQASSWQIWNMCCGFLGLQFGFALQNANVSRIFQTLGAPLEQVPLLWIAAPLTGLLVQPIVGYLSDRTWTRLGRRRPYFLAGALASSLALVLMPRSPGLWVAAGLLWILDGAINVSMEPFRAFVGDQLPAAQRPAGYAMQTFFIGVGAVAGSMLPWLLARAGVSNHAAVSTGAAAVPDTVRYSFDLGAVVMLAAIGWTVIRTREYPPEVLRSFEDATPALHAPPRARSVLLVAGALCDVDLYDGRRRPGALRDRRSALGRLQPRRQLGRGALCRVQRLRRARRGRHPGHGSPLRTAGESPPQPMGGGRGAALLSAVRGSSLAVAADARRGLRLGIDPVAPVRAALDQRAGGEDG